jgi:hypothetical protein
MGEWVCYGRPAFKKLHLIVRILIGAMLEAIEKCSNARARSGEPDKTGNPHGDKRAHARRGDVDCGEYCEVFKPGGAVTELRGFHIIPAEYF